MKFEFKKMNYLLLLLFVLLSALEPFDVTGRPLPSSESGPWTACNVPFGLISMQNDCKRLFLCCQSTIKGNSKLGRRFRHGKVRTNEIGQFDECAKVMEGKEWHGLIIAKGKEGNISFDSSLGIGGFLSTEQINTMATKTEINLTKNSEPFIKEFQNALPFGVFLEDYGLINLALDKLSSCGKSGTKLCKKKCLEQAFQKTSGETTSSSRGSKPSSQRSISLSQGSTSLSQGSKPSSQGSTSLSQGSKPSSQGSTSFHRILASATPIISSTQTTISVVPCARKKGHFCWSKMCKANVTAEEYDRLFPKNGNKFIFASWSGSCGGLGNQIFRYASMYGIGKPYGRKPIFKEDQRCLKSKSPHDVKEEHEIDGLFPIYSSQIKYINEQEKANETLYVEGPKDDPPMHVIANVTEKFIKIYGDVFHHSNKFFKYQRTEMRQIFQFGHAVCKTVEAYQKELFGNDRAHKFCVHVRLGDFKNIGWETKKDFTEQGIDFGCIYLKNKFDFANISVVLIGEDKQFLMDLTFNRQLIANVYVPKAMSRGDDLAFATTACDSLLITAVTSTYSWWIAYLMPDNATIFFDSNYAGKYFGQNHFLPEWIPIRLINGTMTLD